MSIETEISSLTTAIRNLTDVLLATVAKSLPDAPTTPMTAIRYCERPLAPTVTENITPAPEPKETVKKESTPCTHVLSVVGGVPVGVVPVVDLPSHAALVEGVKPLSATTNTPAPAPVPKKTVKEESAPTIAGLCAELVENLGVTVIHNPVAAPVPVPEAPKASEDDQRVQIVELARPNMGDAAFKAFLGGKLAELQGAPCSISGTGKLPKIDAGHLPTLLAAINKQLGK